MISQKINTNKSAVSRDSVINNSVTATLQPDYNIARRFIECFGDENTKQTFQIIPDSKAAKEENKGKILHGSIKSLWNALVNYNNEGYCISFVPNQTNLKGRKKEDIKYYRCFFVDNDNGTPQEYHLKPTIIVNTSDNNSHTYWLFVEEKVNVTTIEINKYERLNKRLVDHYSADSQATDVNKALRMPGFIYQKYDKQSGIQSEPTLVTFEFNNVSYDFNDLLENIESLPDKFDKLLKEKTDWLMEECSKNPQDSKNILFVTAELLSKEAKNINREDCLDIIRNDLLEVGEYLELDKNKCSQVIESAIKSGYYKNKGFGEPATNQNNFSHSKKLSDVDLARKILESGKVDYLVDGWEEWSKVGMCLHSISDELLNDWDNWSSQSEKYEHDCCEKAWNNFKDNGGLGIGSLIHWAEKGGWVNPNKGNFYKKQSSKKNQKKELEEDEYYVTTTIEDSILKVLFDNGLGKWSTIDGIFYQYSETEGYWKKQTQEKILKKISENIRCFYSIDQRSGESKYKFLKNSNIDSSYNVAKRFLALINKNDNNHLIAFSNGTYNIKSQQLEQHNKNNHLTWAIDSNYKKVDDCPQIFKDFIVSSFGAEYIPLIRAIISMYLDPSAPYGYFIHLIGKSGSGKGTLIKLLQSCFHESCITSISHFSELQEAEKRHQYLSGIRFCVAPDVNQYQGNITAFYELVDNGKYSARSLYSSEAYQKQWNCRFLIASTQLLGIDNAAEGWNRRCIALPLKERKGHADLDLAKKLKEAKADIISWALNIEKNQRNELLKNAHKFDPIKKLKSEQETFADSVKAFIDSCTNCDENAEKLTDIELYQHYKVWCKATHYKTIKITSFKQKLNEMLGSFKIGGQVSKDKVTKKTTREPIRWTCIKFVPFLFIYDNQYNKDNPAINERYLQEGNLQDYMDLVTRLHENDVGYTNKKSIDVTAEAPDIPTLQDIGYTVTPIASKNLKNVKLSLPFLKRVDIDAKIQKNKVSPAIGVTDVTEKSETEELVETQQDSTETEQELVTQVVTREDVTNQPIDVTESKKCNRVTEVNVNNADIFATSTDLWDTNIDPFDDGSTQFTVGDTIVYSGNIPRLKKEYLDVMTVDLISQGHIKCKKSDGTKTYWINYPNNFSLAKQ